MSYAQDNLDRHLKEVDDLPIPEAEKEEQKKNLRDRAEGKDGSKVGEWWDKYREKHVQTEADKEAEAERQRESRKKAETYYTDKGDDAPTWTTTTTTRTTEQAEKEKATKTGRYTIDDSGDTYKVQVGQKYENTYAKDNLDRHLAELEELRGIVSDAELEQQELNLRNRALGNVDSKPVAEWWERYRKKYVQTDEQKIAEVERQTKSKQEARSYFSGIGVLNPTWTTEPTADQSKAAVHGGGQYVSIYSRANWRGMGGGVITSLIQQGATLEDIASGRIYNPNFQPRVVSSDVKDELERWNNVRYASGNNPFTPTGTNKDGVQFDDHGNRIEDEYLSTEVQSDAQRIIESLRQGLGETYQRDRMLKTRSAMAHSARRAGSTMKYSELLQLSNEELAAMPGVSWSDVTEDIVPDAFAQRFRETAVDDWLNQVGGHWTNDEIWSSSGIRQLADGSYAFDPVRFNDGGGVSGASSIGGGSFDTGKGVGTDTWSGFGTGQGGGTFGDFGFGYDENGERITGYAPGYESSGPNAWAKVQAARDKEARAAAMDWLDLYFTDGSQRDEIIGIIDRAIQEGSSQTETLREIRASNAYHSRFPGMQLRDQAGFSRLSEAEYIDLEEQYRTALRTYDIPQGFYDDVGDFGEWIAGDVSAREVEERAKLAYEASNHADQELVNQLRAYGLSSGDLTAYYLDPQRELSIVEERDRFRYARLGAAAFRGTGHRFSQFGTGESGRLLGTAERLASAGFGEREVMERLSARRGLLTRLHGEDALSVDELALGEFSLDIESQRKLRRRSSQRAAQGLAQTGETVTDSGLFSQRTV